MTTTINTPPRLLQAAKEFNIGKETLVEFLTDKGFEVNANPSTKLTPEMYKALQVEFAQDKLAKRKSDEIALPKGGGGHDANRKPKDSFDTFSKIKKEDTPVVSEKPKQPEIVKEPVVVAETPKTPEPVQPKVILPSVKPATGVVAQPQKVETQVLNVAKDEVKSDIQPDASTKAIQTPAQEITKTVAGNVPKEVTNSVIPPEIIKASVTIAKPAEIKEVVSEVPNPASPVLPKGEPVSAVKADTETFSDTFTEKATENKAADEEEQKDVTPEHIEIKAPKLDGPNILGKINLDDINMASRPKKGFMKAKDSKLEIRHGGKKQEQGQGGRKDTKTNDVHARVHRLDPPPIVEKTQLRDTNATGAEESDDESALVKPEHIEMKSPRLEGPKIIGKIELPVNQSGGGSGASRSERDRNEKRKRKRIPVDKKPENLKTDERRDRDNRGRGHGDNKAPGAGETRARGIGDNRTSGTGENRAPGTGDSRQHTGNRNDRQRSGTGTGNAQGGQRPADMPRRTDVRPINRGDDRRREPIGTQQQQEIDAKAIQDKIKETQAKLSGSTRGKNQKSKYRRTKRDEMAEKRAAAENAEATNVVQVTEFISVSELANLLDITFADVISKCMSLGIMVSINQRLDAEIIELVAGEFGFEVEFINFEQKDEDEEEEIDDPNNLVARAPIVTIMGHVDHGKTSLLDYIRSANVVAGEAGGITQHIGAYQVTTVHNKKITFLDTPGHEAFTAMRARGAKAADIAVIVIAADDAIMPQTREAISHAQAASLPMIFAINKIDKPGSNPEKIKEQLSAMNILVEDWGGSYQCQEISAKKGTNIDILLEKIGLEADLLELTANPDRIATGTVIEASLDKGRGYQTSMLVQNGTLHQGEMIVCGQYFGKVKAMFNERGQRVTSAVPSTPVQVLGLNGAPQAGEKFKVYEDEDRAKEIATHRAQILREQGIRARKHITLDEIGRRLALGNFKELGIIIKGDFDGSVEALSDSLQKLSTQEVAVRVVHKGVGQITESDVMLATASDAIILGFQVRPSIQAAKLAEQENIEIRSYSIIYDAIQEIRSAMEGLLEPKVEKRVICNVEVREIYKITGVGTIAGCYVTDGKLTRNTKVNLVRDGIVVYSGELASLKRYKDDVKEVAANFECGLSIKNYIDIRVGDIIEGYEEVEVKRTLVS